MLSLTAAQTSSLGTARTTSRCPLCCTWPTKGLLSCDSFHHASPHARLLLSCENSLRRLRAAPLQGIEVYKERPIVYGAGGWIDDYR